MKPLFEGPSFLHIFHVAWKNSLFFHATWKMCKNGDPSRVDSWPRKRRRFCYRHLVTRKIDHGFHNNRSRLMNLGKDVHLFHATWKNESRESPEPGFAGPKPHGGSPTHLFGLPEGHGGRPLWASGLPEGHDGRPPRASGLPEGHGGRPLYASASPDMKSARTGRCSGYPKALKV